MKRTLAFTLLALFAGCYMANGTEQFKLAVLNLVLHSLAWSSMLVGCTCVVDMSKGLGSRSWPSNALHASSGASPTVAGSISSLVAPCHSYLQPRLSEHC